MVTIEALKRKIKNSEDLLSVVQTMKALAMVSIRQYERAVEALAEYNRTIEMGLHIVLHAEETITVNPMAAPQEQVGAILFATDQGLCGQFNERIAAYTMDQLNGMRIGQEARTLIAVGERGAGFIEEAGQPVATRFHVPGSIAGITPLVHELLLAIDEWRRERAVDRILLFHNRPLSSATYKEQMTLLLPLDLAWLQRLQRTAWPSRVLPTFTMQPDLLFSALIRQHLFVTLYRACAESLAAENASRLAAMQNAEKNIEERLVELNTRFHHQRQQSITAELLDIVAGYEAVAGSW